ncbi:hypothetical protein GUITHDRAFT_122960 [Guillardia theta CCMP2712]|nr:hypothetical protein GUITHDRAFT_122960 [Guillardia theta CCMP2712]EKX30826.1 hypothetical protein GUITHDRAFT_122960 [Guillardia theta CCMP2712]|eukprot:XP_005817806.1 hypothetical protein GUITHDRAFT_122960 [Guillardia theta CCMP2712]
MNCSMLNNDPSVKVAGDYRYIGCGPISTTLVDGTTALDASDDICKDRANYYIKNWLGILQQGNVNIIDTSLVGTIQITIGFASAAVLAKSYPNATDETTYPSPDYTLSDIKFNMTKINMPSWWYEGMRTQLMNGTTYSLYFPHYNVFTGQSNPSKSQTTRFTIASDSLDYVLGTFIPSDYTDTTKLKTFGDSTNNKDKTIDAVISGGKGSSQNQSRYFRRNGDNLLSSQWTLGSEKLPQVPNTLTGCVQSVVEAFNLHQSADGGFYKGCTDIEMFSTFFFADILSLQHVGDTSGIMLVSGLDTRQLPIIVEWSTRDVGTTTYSTSSQYWTPFIIAAETRKCDISAGNSVSIN